MLRSIKHQAGLTIVELMVGVLVGIIILAGVLNVFIATVSSSNESLQSARLNQELRAIMTIMVDDIRRAGYWGSASNSTSNPFANPSANTSLQVRDTAASGNIEATSGPCIVFVYDATFRGGTAGTVDASEDYFGYRWEGTSSDGIDMRKTSASGTVDDCTNGSWEAITSPDITITALSFSTANTQCFNTSVSDGVDDDGDAGTSDAAEENCTAPPSTGDISVSTQQVDITLSGQLTSDSDVKQTLNETVKVRNNLVQTH